jgi:tripartite-type tricarboxylate transporter receptor subunit TctC
VKVSRRRFLHLSTSAAGIAGASRLARAQSYPSRPVHWIVGYPPGGGNDIVARLMGQWLSDRLGQQIVIENRPGAATNIAAEIVVNAPADGYTLLLVNPANASNATLFKNLNFDFVRDIAPVAGILRSPFVMVVNPAFPAKSVSEFIAYAKANPGKINMASAGNGTGTHLAGELFKMLAGIDMVHVPYRGNGPALTDLLGGRVQVMFPPTASPMGFIKSGTLRALGVTTLTRAETLPDVPPIVEAVPGYEASAWYGIGAPRKTPAEIIDKLNQENNAGLADSTMRARFADLGGVPLAMSPAEFGDLIVEETAKWAKVVKFADIKPEE